MAVEKTAPVPPVARDAVYVVQQAQMITFDPEVGADATAEAWVDLATVSVPFKSKRKTIIGLALVQAEIKPQPGDEPLRLRVLPAAVAVVTTVAAKAVAPQLEMS